MGIRHVAAVGTGGTVDAVGAEMKEFDGLFHAEFARLGPRIVRQSLEVGLPVFADPLTIRVFIEELRPIAGIAVIENIEPRQHFHTLFVRLADENRRRVEIADDFRVAMVPRCIPSDAGFQIPFEMGRGICPCMFGIEMHRIGQLRAIGEESQTATTDQKCLTSVLFQLRD